MRPLPRHLLLKGEAEQAVAAGDLRGGQRIDALAAKAQNGHADERGEELVEPQIAAVAAPAQKERRAVDGENLVAVAGFEHIGEAIRELGRSKGVILHQAVDLVDIRKDLTHTGVRAARREKCENALAIGMCFCSGDQGAALPFGLNSERTYAARGRDRTANLYTVLLEHCEKMRIKKSV